MKLNPAASATIIIGGLALCHQNKQNETWEALFIRDDENLHKLKMRIGYGEKQEPEIDIVHGAEISVKVVKPKSKSGNYTPTETFSRSYALNVINDSRWVLNFSGPELHDKPLSVEKRQRDNFFSTPNALFYTLSLSGKHYLLRKTDDGKPIDDPKSLHDIGEFLAGDIECEDSGTIIIEIRNLDGAVESYTLKKGAQVFFDNRCLTDSPECANDFSHYYDVIKTENEKFEIEYVPTLIERWLNHLSGFEGKEFACEVGMICCVNNPDDTLNYPKV